MMASRNRVSRLKTWVVNTALCLVVLLVSLAVGEGVLRAFVRLPLPRKLPEVKYAPHPVRRFTLLPNQVAFSYGAPVRIDDRGFRVTIGGYGAHGERADLLALGDSFTFGLGVRDEETWPSRLQQKLSQAAGRRISTVNAGTISYGVFQELNLLKASGLATRPRVLVHGLYWNDFMNAGAPEPGAAPVIAPDGYFTWDQLSQPRGALRKMTSSAISSSALLFTLRQAANARRAGVLGSGYAAAYARFLQQGLTPAEWQIVERFYLDLKQLAREHDFGLLVAIMPVSDLIHRRPSQVHAYPTGARALLQRLEIPFVDGFQLTDAQHQPARLFLPESADAHLNAAGYQVVASALSEALARNPALRWRLAF